MRFGVLLIATGLVSTAACRDRSERAAEKTSGRQTVQYEAQEATRAAPTQEPAQQEPAQQQPAQQPRSQAPAGHADEQRRDDRLRTLVGEFATYATQPLLINSIAMATPLTDQARADLNEKLRVFQLQVDQTGNAIQSMQSVEPAGFEDRDRIASDALDRLAVARDDAWRALEQGQRTTAPQTAS
ncbi:MAG: hypothetical protein ACTHU0_10245 [Kofleriaceae bacterium]